MGYDLKESRKEKRKGRDSKREKGKEKRQKCRLKLVLWRNYSQLYCFHSN